MIAYCVQIKVHDESRCTERKKRETRFVRSIDKSRTKTL